MRGINPVRGCVIPRRKDVKEELEIKVFGNDVEKALKVLKREMQKEGLLGELKRRRYYEKPSVKSRRKSREARKRLIKSLRRKR